MQSFSEERIGDFFNAAIRFEINRLHKGVRPFAFISFCESGDRSAQRRHSAGAIVTMLSTEAGCSTLRRIRSRASLASAALLAAFTQPKDEDGRFVNLDGSGPKGLGTALKWGFWDRITGKRPKTPDRAPVPVVAPDQDRIATVYSRSETPGLILSTKLSIAPSGGPLPGMPFAPDQAPSLQAPFFTISRSVGQGEAGHIVNTASAAGFVRSSIEMKTSVEPQERLRDTSSLQLLGLQNNVRARYHKQGAEAQP